MNIENNLKTLIVKNPLKLDCGKTIKDFPIAYETYGSLNSQKDNAILVFHALTGDQYVSGTNPVTKKDGWWSYAVGPGKAIDTNKYFVICSNVIGGCMGSFGPSDLDPENGNIKEQIFLSLLLTIWSTLSIIYLIILGLINYFL
jgi:homoserine O-acetyltransferase